MLDIEYKGGNSIVITTKGLKFVVDPNTSILGLKNVNVKDAVVLATESRFLTDSEDSRLTIEGPGEYEVGDASIRGIAAERHIDAGGFGSTIYRMSVGEVRLAVIGNIAANLDEDQLEAIGVVDVVVIPVGGGGYTLDAVNATKLVRQIDPKVVVPVHYAENGVSYEVSQDALKLFIDELGVDVESVEKYKLKSSAGLPPAMMIVEIKRS